MVRMTFNQMVDFIMERLDVPQPERRSTRDKVRKRVRSGLGDGKLIRLDLETTDVDRDQLIVWARTKWPGKFDIPTNSFVQVSDSANFDGELDAVKLPASIEECHALIRGLNSRNRLLVMMLNRQAAIIADLRPLAEQYERNRAKNRASAKKPRDR
jgi:hypothetical protein